ncbi:hypothetical protein M430DRAFT_250735 [Amorphotheca resinae ATCC 22711]|jgi:hypothetical protein|uniref:Uncharacterized protein n=1 Tax=Amorphotheca resinae ATCC 22711 TaxID=857342 RepID=A0A2T3B0N0_AMORE|nr:hypothetical protein M430DRAFT_250735 [Amorphotheca resinae ATCC 22711]PSS16961.1 hypothetical protein M430DRAFT_250735 [Amorphotheca resinae ATCC 22711]
MMFTRGFSLTNFIIGTSALSFQVFVLYPWHQKLDDDFEEMKREHLKAIHASEKARLEGMKEIREAIAKLK